MRHLLLFFLLLLPSYTFSLDEFKVTTIQLKHRLAKNIVPYLMPHLAEDGKITFLEKSITVRSRKTNFDEIIVIIGDMDRYDYIQLIISISMNMQAVNNKNTRSIQVGTNTWTKINYGITYSKRVRETLDNGQLVEKIKSIQVTESFQVHTTIDDSNKVLTLKIRASQDNSSDTVNKDNLELNELEMAELSATSLTIKVQGKINQWINLGNAINTLYLNDNNSDNSNIIKERQQLTSKMGIKVQLLQ